jgi:uncharacterized membrane protein YtjA (UPF0391 family)
MAERCAPNPFSQSTGRAIAILLSGGFPMLHYAWIFLVLAIIAAIFGFGGIAVAAAGIAKVLFFIFIALFIIGLLTGRRAI